MCHSHDCIWMKSLLILTSLYGLLHTNPTLLRLPHYIGDRKRGTGRQHKSLISNILHVSLRENVNLTHSIKHLLAVEGERKRSSRKNRRNGRESTTPVAFSVKQYVLCAAAKSGGRAKTQGKQRKTMRWGRKSSASKSPGTLSRNSRTPRGGTRPQNLLWKRNRNAALGCESLLCTAAMSRHTATH